MTIALQLETRGQDFLRLNNPSRVTCGVKQIGLGMTLMAAMVTVAGADTPAMESPGIAGEGAIHPLPQAAYQPQKQGYALMPLSGARRRRHRLKRACLVVAKRVPAARLVDDLL